MTKKSNGKKAARSTKGSRPKRPQNQKNSRKQRAQKAKTRPKAAQGRSSAKEETLTGLISLNTRGIGYVKTTKYDEDIEIPHEYLNRALNNDEVRIAVERGRRQGRISGRITKIIKRHKMTFVGTVQKEGEKIYFVPDDRKIYTDILLHPNVKAKVDDKALVHITNWPDPMKAPEGEVVEVIGPKGEHQVEMRSIVLSKGIDTDFPKAVEAEAQNIAKTYKQERASEITKRRDFRNITTFTIDPADAKDFDDAISLKKLANDNLEVGIHIADVSHFVTEGSELDAEARKRELSVYLVDRTIPMLPEVLSNDLCSLNPREDKYAMSAVFEMTKQGKVVSRWFGKTMINSNKRFSYEEAQALLDQKSGEYYHELKILNDIAYKLRTEKEANGAIDFETDEVKFVLDEAGKPIKVYKKARLDTHKLVEDFMLLANREVAIYIYDKQKKGGRQMGASLYRTHDVPKSDKLQELGIFLRALGYEFNLNTEHVTSKDIAAILGKIKGKAEEALVKTAALRTMAKAMYSTKNIGHFGLAFQYYTHFTSPIRRYPDLIIHRIMDRYLNNKKIPTDLFAKYDRIALEASEKEIAAAEAERESIKYKQVEYMSEHVGETFDVIISGVTEWGIYVEEPNTRAEGLVRISELGDDYFVLDQKNYAVVGEKSKLKYSLGDQIKVKLVTADLERRTLDFKISN